MRKHLWPVLVDRPSQKAGKTFADRVAESTGINPTLDIRELILASMDSKSWVLLVGGSFKPGKFVPGMEKVFQEEGHPGWRRAGDLLIGPTGIAMGQADDGTLVLGTEAEIVTAALPASEEYKRIDLPRDGVAPLPGRRGAPRRARHGARAPRDAPRSARGLAARILGETRPDRAVAEAREDHLPREGVTGSSSLFV